MLFNSQFFIFVFLPATLAIYFALGRLSRVWALRWIIVASLIFYAWWRPVNVFIIVPAMLVNFAIARLMVRSHAQDRVVAARIALTAGIVFDVLFLGYFKYTNFVLTVSNDVFGSNFVLQHIVLPLGISFITFQMIAFLVDVYGKRVDSFRLQDFCSFVLFFPQLIAGPIVHYREMMPQFHAARCTWNREDVSIGITLFLFGLFKKVFLADGIAPFVSAIYAGAESGTAVSLIPAWLASVGFTFQIYFDFSGYTDMALGAARLFGIRLPVNFNSPLKSSNIIDFWLRWHVSLTRFLTAYVYNPIALHLTRRRLASGRGAVAGPNTSAGAFLQVLALPTIFTMFVSGIWHGAGYLFLLWGLLHGVFLAINHGWRLFANHRWHGSARYQRIMRPTGFLLTFTGVAVSMVLFRSTSLDAASNILRGMVGLNGIELPTAVYDRLVSAAAWLPRMGLAPDLPNAADLKTLTIWVVLLMPVVFLLPNSLQVMEQFKPAIGTTPTERANFLFGTNISWRASPAWAVIIAILGFFAVRSIGGYSEFLYWQF